MRFKRGLDMSTFQRFKTMPRESKRRIAARYAVFQIPDLLILVLILLVLQWLTDLPSWGYAGIIGFWIVKDVLMFPLVWRAYDSPRPGDAKTLIGTEGIAEEQLNPLGYVRVHGELWQAEVMGKKARIEKGETVVIEGVYGLILLVQPRPERDSGRTTLDH